MTLKNVIAALLLSITVFSCAAGEESANPEQTLFRVEDVCTTHLVWDPATGRIVRYIRNDQPEAKALSDGDWAHSINNGMPMRIDAIAENRHSFTVDEENDWRHLSSYPDRFSVDNSRGRGVSNYPRRIYPIRRYTIGEGIIIGGERAVWTLGKVEEEFWKTLGERIREHNAGFLLYTDFYDVYRKVVNRLTGRIVHVTPERLEEVEKARITYEDIRKNWNWEYDRISPTSIEEPDHVKPEYFIAQILLDIDSGRILSYARYNNYMERIQMDLRLLDEQFSPIQRHVYAVTQDARERLAQSGDLSEIFNDDRKGIDYIAADTDELLVEEADVEKAGKNLFTFFPGAIYGSECFIWDLPIWRELGERLKGGEDVYYLGTKATCSEWLARKVEYGDREFPDEDLWVRIDLELYEELELTRNGN